MRIGQALPWTCSHPTAVGIRWRDYKSTSARPSLNDSR